MWTKLLVVVMAVLFLFAGAYFLKKEPPASGHVGARDAEQQVLKRATNVVMYERRTDTDKTFVIRARTVTQQSEQVFFMESFRMDRSDGMTVEGRQARYDTNANRIDVPGPMVVSTTDGWKAELTDVAWDREQKYAATNRPVTLTGDRGTLRADRAEFFNDFSRIELSGRVHAQVAQKLLAD
jgi:hypothetical protein